MNYITKIVQALEDSNILLKGVSKILEKKNGIFNAASSFDKF